MATQDDIFDSLTAMRLLLADQIDYLSDIAAAVNASDSGKSQSSGSSGIGDVLSSLGSLGGVIGAATNAIKVFAAAVGGVAAAIGGIVFAARAFVQFFDPSLVQAFDAALKDLWAVIGVGLTPIIAEATKFLRQFASVLYPLTTAILPAMQEMAKAVTDVLLAFLPAVSGVFSVYAAMIPVIAELVRAIADFLLPIVRAYVTVMAALVAAAKVAIGVIASLFGSNLRTGFKSLGEWIARAVVGLTVLTFRLFGLNAALDAMVKSLQDGADKAGRKDAAGLAAAQNARIVGVADLGREVLQRAFVTSGRAGQETAEVSDAEFRRTLLADIGKLRTLDISKIITDAIIAGFTAAAGRAPAEVMKQLGVDPGTAKAAGTAAVGAGRAVLSTITGGIL